MTPLTEAVEGAGAPWVWWRRGAEVDRVLGDEVVEAGATQHVGELALS